MPRVSSCIHLDTADFADVNNSAYVLGVYDGSDTSVVKIADHCFFVKQCDEERMLALLENAAHYFRKRINKRKRGSKKPGCTVTLKLAVSGGRTYPSAAPLAKALEAIAAESKSLDLAMNGNTIDNIHVQVCND